jgi:hypothetical protein
MTSAPASILEQRATPNLLLSLWGIGSAIVLLPFLFAVALQWIGHRQLEAIVDPQWTKAIEKLSRKIGLHPFGST